MKIIIEIDDAAASAVAANHGASEVEDIAETMRGLVEYALRQEVVNAFRNAQMRSAEQQINQQIEEMIGTVFTVEKG